MLHVDATLSHVKLNAAPVGWHFLPFGPNTTPVCTVYLYSFTGFNNLQTLYMKNVTSLKTLSRSPITKQIFPPRSRCVPVGVPRTFSSGVKQAALEADHSSPFRAELGNVWNYTTSLPYAFMTCTGTFLLQLKFVGWMQHVCYKFHFSFLFFWKPFLIIFYHRFHYLLLFIL